VAARLGFGPRSSGSPASVGLSFSASPKRSAATRGFRTEPSLWRSGCEVGAKIVRFRLRTDRTCVGCVPIRCLQDFVIARALFAPRIRRPRSGPHLDHRTKLASGLASGRPGRSPGAPHNPSAGSPLVLFRHWASIANTTRPLSVDCSVPPGGRQLARHALILRLR
jgi:hypothetical protein